MSITHLKFNMEPENQPPAKEIPNLETIIFRFSVKLWSMYGFHYKTHFLLFCLSADKWAIHGICLRFWGKTFQKASPHSPPIASLAGLPLRGRSLATLSSLPILRPKSKDFVPFLSQRVLLPQKWRNSSLEKGPCLEGILWSNHQFSEDVR